MKKLINLIVLLVVLAVLVVGYVIYSDKVAEDEKAGEETTVDTSVLVLSIDSSKINTIEYANDRETVSFKKEGEVWQWAEDPEFPLDKYYPELMVSTLSSIVADRLIADDLSNEADFGMDEPSFAIKYTTTEGKEYVYTIGDYNSAAQGYYIKSSEQDKIFMTKTSPTEPFIFYLLEMAEVDYLAAPSAETISKVEYNADGKSNIVTKDGADVLYPDPYTYFVFDENGVKRGADGQAATEFIQAVSAIKLGDVIAFKPNAETLEKCGLVDGKLGVFAVEYEEKVGSDNSDASVHVTTKKNYKIIIGKSVDEAGETKYYATFEGSFLLYEISGGAELYTALNKDFVSKLVCPVLADDVVSFRIETKDGERSYAVTELESNEKVTELFNTITSIVSDGKAEGEKGESVCKVTFDTGSKELVLEVFKLDESNCIATFCGEDRVVSYAKIKKIIDSLV